MNSLHLHKALAFMGLRTSPRLLPAKPTSQFNPTSSRRTTVSCSVRGKKENVWSIDNDVAKEAAEEAAEEAARERGRKQQQRRRNGRRTKGNKGARNKRSVEGGIGTLLVSESMLMEVETVLQTQEPVIKPAWNTFASSVSGVWKGAGAVFSPITAEMEPVDIGSKNQSMYDCYTVSSIKAIQATSPGMASQIRRKINWVTHNPFGEKAHEEVAIAKAVVASKTEDVPVSRKGVFGQNQVLPKFSSFEFGASDLMEEDLMGNEPGLVFFEDGSYSRGPVDLPVGEKDDSNYYLTPTFKFEQCLVKGCHKRLRIVHTIEFNGGGADIQIMRVAVYEEEWVSPANFPDESDLEFDVEPLSQRKRTQPSDLAGSWKVFEISATPMYGEDPSLEGGSELPYVYLCTETLKKRTLPGSMVYFGEEETLDMQDVTVLWLPGGVTAYVDVSKDGVLCIGCGWYSDEGINLAMERDYGLDGKMKEARYKSEVKRRWFNPM